MHRKSFLTLSEAVAWLAIGRPTSASELINSIQFAPEAEAISIRSELIKAFERYVEAANAGFVSSYGRYHARPLVDDRDAATLPIPASAYHDFRRFDMLNDGLRRGRGLYPRYSPAGMDTADDVDRGGPAYSAVRLSRGELVDHFGLEVAECGKPNAATSQTRASPHKKGRPPSVEAIREQAEKMYVEGLNRDQIAKNMRNVPGFENAGNVVVREALAGVRSPGPRKG